MRKTSGVQEQTSGVQVGLGISHTLPLSVGPAAEYGIFSQDLECAQAKGQVCKCALVFRCALAVPA